MDRNGLPPAKNAGPLELGGKGAMTPPLLCAGMGAYTDISWESKCNIEIEVWANFCQILVFFEDPCQLRDKGMSENS